MNQLHAMFSNMDREVIMHVLESKRGNVEQSVEALLAMNSAPAPARAVRTAHTGNPAILRLPYCDYLIHELCFLLP